MHMELTDVAPAAKDVGAADALWEWTEEWIAGKRAPAAAAAAGAPEEVELEAVSEVEEAVSEDEVEEAARARQRACVGGRHGRTSLMRLA